MLAALIVIRLLPDGFSSYLREVRLRWASRRVPTTGDD
jgi:hypothetical protein